MTNLKVAVRVRPFSPIEATDDSRSTLDWHSESSITLKKLRTSAKFPRHQHEAHSSEADAGTTRLFTFDNCFWSDHTTQPNNHASQQTIFDTIGAQMLDALFEGINTSVLAYGQSGTGKTYTMMGTEGNPGLAPRLCLEVFERINANNIARCNKYTSKPYFRVEVSFMEIYNEKVRDLLDNNGASGAAKKPPVALRIREHPKFGPYVEGLKRLAVSNGHEALKLLHNGMQRRMSAATQANIHSSRSHAIFTIYFTTVQVAGSDMPREITAKLNVVDLAGSERTTRDDDVNRVRLKEGAQINRSLATLGNVINALAEKSSTNSTAFTSTPRLSDLSLASSVSVESFPSASSTYYSSSRRTPFVPYRNSVLTWILKDSLGGNARTFLVAAVSPYSGAYKETLSTLRFAQRAKLVVNRPVVNEESSVAVIRHLKNEVLRLKTLLNQMVDSKESMNDSIIYTEAIIEDSINVRSPSTLEITEPQREDTDDRNAATKGSHRDSANKEFKDASAQTVLCLVNDNASNDLESFSDASYDDRGSDSSRVFGVKKDFDQRKKKSISSKHLLVDNFEIPKNSYAIQRSATPTSRISATSKLSGLEYSYLFEEDGSKATPTASLRSFQRPCKLQQRGKNHPDLDLVIAVEGSQSSIGTQNSAFPTAFDKNHEIIGNKVNTRNRDNRLKREDSAGTFEYGPETGSVIAPDSIVSIVRGVQLNSSNLEVRKENMANNCPCSARQSSARHVSPFSCDNSKHNSESQLNNFRLSIRQELLAIRRRLVARTASPQIAKTLPYLSEAPYYNARNLKDQC